MRLIDADALIDGYKHMGYDPSEHPEESYMEGWCKGFNSAVDHCVHHAIHAPTIEPERTGHWNRLMMYLADLQLTYAPMGGHGDIRLYEFVTGLIEELEGWEDGGGA